jgi:amino acid transporter
MTSSTASSAPSVATPSAQKLSLSSLTAMVIGSMVGAGIFNLPGRFATATGPFGAIIAWAIAGTGMYMLARVFQALAEKRPDIDSVVFAYAKPDLATTWAFYRPSATGSGVASGTSSTGC